MRSIGGGEIQTIPRPEQCSKSSSSTAEKKKNKNATIVYGQAVKEKKRN